MDALMQHPDGDAVLAEVAARWGAGVAPGARVVILPPRTYSPGMYPQWQQQPWGQFTLVNPAPAVHPAGRPAAGAERHRAARADNLARARAMRNERAASKSAERRRLVAQMFAAGAPPPDEAARILGVHRSTLLADLRLLGLAAPRIRRQDAEALRQERIARLRALVAGGEVRASRLAKALRMDRADLLEMAAAAGLALPGRSDAVRAAWARRRAGTAGEAGA